MRIKEEGWEAERRKQGEKSYRNSSSYNIQAEICFNYDQDDSHKPGSSLQIGLKWQETSRVREEKPSQEHKNWWEEERVSWADEIRDRKRTRMITAVMWEGQWKFKSSKKGWNVMQMLERLERKRMRRKGWKDDNRMAGTGEDWAAAGDTVAGPW